MRALAWQAASAACRAHEAHVTGLYVIHEPELPGFITAQLPRDAIDAQRASAEEAARAATGAFPAKADREGIKADSRIARAPVHEVAALLRRTKRVPVNY